MNIDALKQGNMGKIVKQLSKQDSTGKYVLRIESIRKLYVFVMPRFMYMCACVLLNTHMKYCNSFSMRDRLHYSKN